MRQIFINIIDKYNILYTRYPIIVHFLTLIIFYTILRGSVIGITYADINDRPNINENPWIYPDESARYRPIMSGEPWVNVDRLYNRDIREDWQEEFLYRRYLERVRMEKEMYNAILGRVIAPQIDSLATHAVEHAFAQNNIDFIAYLVATDPDYNPNYYNPDVDNPDLDADLAQAQKDDEAYWILQH